MYPCAYVGVCPSVSVSGTPRGLRDAGNCHFTALPEPHAREAPAGRPAQCVSAALLGVQR